VLKITKAATFFEKIAAFGIKRGIKGDADAVLAIIISLVTVTSSMCYRYILAGAAAVLAFSCVGKKAKTACLHPVSVFNLLLLLYHLDLFLHNIYRSLRIKRSFVQEFYRKL